MKRAKLDICKGEHQSLGKPREEHWAKEKTFRVCLVGGGIGWMKNKWEKIEVGVW